jgi:hypothetical protein
VAPGDQFLIVTSIKNLGTTTTSGYYIDVYYDSDYGRGGPDNITAGETQIWYVGPLIAQAGTHTTKWVVNPDEQIVESNYNNNEKDLTFTIGSQTTTTPPVVIVPANMTVNATGPSGAVVIYTASASDVVDGAITPSCSPASSSTFAIGSTKVICSATDEAGNTGSASFNVNVVDKTPPKLTLPSDMTVQATSASGAVVKFTASASDIVDGSVPITCTPTSGSTFPVGTTTVTCSAKDKAGNSASGSFKVTVAPISVTVTVKLLSSNGKGISGGVVQYYSSAWKSFGTTGSAGTVSVALPPGTYGFQITYAGASQQKSQNVLTNSTVVFQTTLVTMKLLSSTNKELNATAQYYAGGWNTFGSGTTTTTMELLPVTYNFQVTYAGAAPGASQQKSQDVSKNPNVVFQTTLVTMQLLSSTNTQLSGGAQYYASGWHTFGSGTTTTTMELLPLTYNFVVTYAGASQQKSQNVATNPLVTFQTTLVTMKLLAHDGATVLSGGAQYYASSAWHTFGSGTTTTTMQLLPLTYNFQVTYAGASQQVSQNVTASPGVVFKTTLVTMKILSSTNTELNGVAQYWAGSWKTFGTGTTTTSMELLPLTYSFQVSYAGASQQLSQNVASNANVIFQTVQVHSDSGKCTSYNAGGWKTFTQDMQLLPGTYTFRFSDGTANTSYTLVVGAVKHIH